jgi:hypothetical protein
MDRRSKLLKQVFSTYFWLRFGLVVIGVGFPILLWAWGKVKGLPLQDSMSAYYWAPPVQGEGEPVRALFVGGLFAIGSFLFIYKGYTRRESIVLNFAALCVIGVALVPMGWNCGSDCPSVSVHYLLAISAFFCLAFVAFFEARETLDELGDQRLQILFNIRLKTLFNILYWATSLCFFLGPLVVLGWHWRYQNSTVTFWLEASLIYAFALFWSFKSLELFLWEAERQTLQEAQDARKAADTAARRHQHDAREAVE